VRPSLRLFLSGNPEIFAIPWDGGLKPLPAAFLGMSCSNSKKEKEIGTNDLFSDLLTYITSLYAMPMFMIATYVPAFAKVNMYIP
jgi:hypothetical protein